MAMKVNEIFLSIQGESLTAGFPTIFVRFSGCNLRCHYCDTTYAYDEGEEMLPDEVFNEIKKFHYQRVCLTGGEPLLQKDLNLLLARLEDYMVTIETNGAVRLDQVQLADKHSFVMDIKLPSSGCFERMCMDNFRFLSGRDEIKFVIGNQEDYECAKTVLKKYYQKGTVIFSPVYGKIEYPEMVRWILNDRLDVRFQLQLHKLIWKPDQRGV